MNVDRRIPFEYATCGQRNFFNFGNKKLRIQKYRDTCGRGPFFIVKLMFKCLNAYLLYGQLHERARRMKSCAVQENFPESHIINPLLTKLV